jgi:hypothetical protein
MKRRIALVLVMVVASISVHAQVGGLLRKKAGEVVGGKKTPPVPAPATPAPTPETSGSSTPATPAGGAVTTPTNTAPAARTAASPLEVSELPVRQSADQVLRGRVIPRGNGDWDQLPYIPRAAVAAAYALGESARVALVDTVGSAMKAMVTSPAFVSEHNEYIKKEYQAVDHGLKGVVSIEAAMKKNDMAALEAIRIREMVTMGVDTVKSLPPQYRKEEFTRELPEWKANAAKLKGSEQAKFKKMVAIAQPLEALPADDEKLLRGYAVIKSIENDGPDTEAAVFAMHQRVKQEREQLAFDEHQLNGELKQQLTAFVAIASTVNFKAATVQKGSKTVFVNAADERQGALWKACFRAGEASTAAAVKLARAWLAEL